MLQNLIILTHLLNIITKSLFIIRPLIRGSEVVSNFLKDLELISKMPSF